MDLPYEHPERMIEVKLYEGGLPTGRLNLDFSVMNYAKYVKEKIVSNCESGDVEQVSHIYAREHGVGSPFLIFPTNNS